MRPQPLPTQRQHFLHLTTALYQAPAPTLSQLVAPHKGFQILDASSLTFTNMGTKR